MYRAPETAAGSELSAEIAGILDDAWIELQRATAGGSHRLHVPEISETEARRRASVGIALADRIKSLPPLVAGSHAAAALAVASYHARRWSSEESFYWTAFECGGWFKSMFAPTGDGLGRVISSVLQQFDNAEVTTKADAEEWMHAISNLARLVSQLTERTKGQADRGIFMPQLLFPSAIALVKGMRGQAKAIRKPAALLASEEIDRRMTSVDQAFAGFEAVLDADYAAHCSEHVGISQYPDGLDAYDELLFQNTTVDLSPERIHRIGEDEVAEIFERMQMLSSDAGFGSDVATYRASLDADPRWRASSAEDIADRFRHHMGKMEKVVLDYFHHADLPRAPYDARALPSVLEGTMAYGYYDQPRQDRPEGVYLFNASNLMTRSLVDVGAFTYHELVPGHHVHFAGQLENTELHPLQRHTFCNAFNEGWAEYGRRLAEDAGLYDEPAEVFGGLANDMRQATRLVVDTGLNVLGWSSDQARRFISKYSLIPFTEVDALINWYACEIPGQSVAYSLGRREMLRFRDIARESAGAAFDIRNFHHTVLRHGGRPLGAVEADIRFEAEASLKP